LKKTLISSFVVLIFISCRTEESKLVTVNINPLIQYYKSGQNVSIISSDFQMGKEREFCEKGISLILEGDISGGEEELLKALSVNPNSSITLNNLGNLKYLSKEFPAAIDYFNESIIISDSTYYPSILNLGKLYGLIGDDEKAEELLNYVIENSEIDFLNGISHFRLSRMYLDYGWIDKAKLSLSKSKTLLGPYNDFDSDLNILSSRIENYN